MKEMNGEDYILQFSYGEGCWFWKKDLIDVIIADPDNDKRMESRKVISHKIRNLHWMMKKYFNELFPGFFDWKIKERGGQFRSYQTWINWNWCNN